MEGKIVRTGLMAVVAIMLTVVSIVAKAALSVIGVSIWAFWPLDLAMVMLFAGVALHLRVEDDPELPERTWAGAKQISPTKDNEEC